MADYLFSPGIDLSGIREGLSKIEDGFQETANTVIKTTESMGQGFANAGKKIEDATKPLTAAYGSIQFYAQKLRDTQDKLFVEGDINKIRTYNQQIEQFKNQILSLGNAGKKGFDEFGDKLKQQESILQRLQRQVQIYKTGIQEATNPANIAKYNQKLQETELELKRLSNAGKVGFDQFGNSINATVPVLDKATKSTNALSKGFGLIRQAAYLIPGIGIAGILNLIIEPVVKLTQDLLGESEAQKKAAEASKKHADELKELAENARTINDIQDDAVGSVQAQIVEVESLAAVLTNQNATYTERNRALEKLKEINKNYFGDLTTEKNNVDAVRKAVEDYTNAIAQQAIVKELESDVGKIGAAYFRQQRVVRDLEQQIRSLNLEQTNYYVSQGGFSDAQNNRVLILDKTTKGYADKLLILNQELRKQKPLLDPLADQFEKLKKELGAANIEFLKFKPLGGDGGDGDAKKAAKQLEDYNKILQDLNQQRRDLNAKALDENEQSEIAASNAKFKKQLENDQERIKNFKGTQDQLNALRAAFNEVEKASEQAAREAREDIQKKYADRRLKLEEQEAAAAAKIQSDAEKALASIGEDTVDRQVTRIREKYRKIYEAVAAAGQDNDETTAGISKSLSDEIANVLIKDGEKRIATQERTDLRLIDLDTKYANKSVAIQKAKELAKLNVQLDAAEDRLSLLQTNGKTENDQEVQNAVDLIEAIKAKIMGVQNNNGKGESLFEFLGIDADGQRDIDRYAKAASAAGRITSDFLGAIADGYQRQIDARKAAVDADDKAIDDLEGRVDKQKELYNQGVANNYDALKRELEDKKAMREADQKNLEDIQKKQNAVKKAQIIADSVAQVSNLITASTEIFAAFSAIPFVGVPLAIAAIGVMFGAFAAAKINAIRNVGTAQSFGGGGVVDGPAHTQGGKKYRAVDGSGDVVELEGGEHVTRRDKTKQFLPVLEKINDGSISLMGDEALRELLRGTGIHLSEAPKQTVKIIREHTTLKQQVEGRSVGHDLTDEVKKIKEDVKYMADKKRNDWEYGEDESRTFKKKGGLTVFTTKKKN